jgi:hypothetical protein
MECDQCRAEDEEEEEENEDEEVEDEEDEEDDEEEDDDEDTEEGNEKMQVEPASAGGRTVPKEDSAEGDRIEQDSPVDAPRGSGRKPSRVPRRRYVRIAAETDSSSSESVDVDDDGVHEDDFQSSAFQKVLDPSVSRDGALNALAIPRRPPVPRNALAPAKRTHELSPNGLAAMDAFRSKIPRVIRNNSQGSESSEQGIEDGEVREGEETLASGILPGDDAMESSSPAAAERDPSEVGSEELGEILELDGGEDGEIVEDDSDVDVSSDAGI